MKPSRIQELRRRLDGEVLTEGLELERAGSDHGHIVSHRPLAVVSPRTELDVAETVRFAADCGLTVVARGQGHSTFGQAQAEGSLVIDMASLSGVVTESSEAITVKAGTTWRQVVDQCAASGPTPTILPDILDLSIGGMLSVGGVGSQSFRQGLMIDQARSLRIVTARGEVVDASPDAHEELFHSVLGGLGQFGIIVEATVAAVPIPAPLVAGRMVYTDAQAFLNDLMAVQQDSSAYSVAGIAAFGPDSTLQYLLDVARVGPDLQPLSSRLSHRHIHDESQEVAYSDFVFRNHGGMEDLKAADLWEIPHPWFDVFIPSDAAEAFMGRELNEMTVEDMGPAGMLVFYPVMRPAGRAGATATPDGRFVEMGLLRTAPKGDSGQVQRLLDSNRRLFDRAVSAGGKQYPIGAVPMASSDWIRHFGGAWERLNRLKQIHDPKGVFADPRGIGWGD